MTGDDAWGDHLDPEGEAPATDLTAGERRVVDAVRDQLRSDALWDAPPPDLRGRLLARAAAEQAAGQTGPTRPLSVQRPEPPAVRPAPAARRNVQRRRAGWLVAAAAAVVIGGGAVALWPRPQVQTFALAGTTLAPAARADVRLEPKSAGVAIELHITGLKAAPPGAYYAAWLRGPAGVVPVGTFHWHKGGIPIDLWSGVTSDRYPELFVTLQQEGAGPGPSGQVVMQGRTS